MTNCNLHNVVYCGGGGVYLIASGLTDLFNSTDSKWTSKFVQLYR